MEAATKPKQQRNKKRDNRIESIYSRCLITKNIILPITAIGKNISSTIEENIKLNFEGKCGTEGYIKPGSVHIITYSSGLITRGNLISFEVIFECEVCFPIEGMIIQCIAKNITKAGIRAESFTDTPSPIIVFLARDHHFTVNQFSDINVGDKIDVRVIGQRFELNDKYISIIGEYVKPKPKFDKTIMKNREPRPLLVIEEEV